MRVPARPPSASTGGAAVAGRAAGARPRCESRRDPRGARAREPRAMRERAARRTGPSACRSRTTHRTTRLTAVLVERPPGAEHHGATMPHWQCFSFRQPSRLQAPRRTMTHPPRGISWQSVRSLAGHVRTRCTPRCDLTSLRPWPSGDWGAALRRIRHGGNEYRRR